MSNFVCYFLPALIGIGSAVIGGLIGWYLRRTKIEELAEVINAQENNYLRLKSANETLSVKYDNLQNSFDKLYNANTRLHNEFMEIDAENKAIKAQSDILADNYLKKIRELNNQNEEWRVSYETLLSRSTEQLPVAADNQQAIEERDTVITQLKGELQNAQSHIEDWQRSYQKLMDNLEAFRANESGRITDLKYQLEELRLLNKQLTTAREREIQRTADLQNQIEEWRVSYEKLLAEKTPPPQLSDTDSRLNSISRLYQDTVLERDGLQKIISRLEAELAEYRKTIKPDDLKIIEGIGAKIEALLHNAGILTFGQLAESDDARIKAILEKAGSHYSMHSPHTWTKQAALARDGHWEQLKAYKDHLSGGQEPEAQA